MLRDIPNSNPITISVTIVLLAAGMARRMGENGAHKLLAQFDGVPLVRRSALSAINSQAASVNVVVGHRQHEIRQALSGLQLNLIENPDYPSGMASSLATGFSTVEAESTDGVFVMRADMPGVSTYDLNRLIAVFQQAKGLSIVRAVSHGKRGNPVIPPHALQEAVLRLEDDIGARHIIETSGLTVIDVEIGDAAHIELDTPDAIAAAGGVIVA